MSSILRSPFGATPDGLPVGIFTLTNDSGAVAKVSNFGGVLTELWVPDRDGRLGDVTLGFEDLESYLENPPHFGATIGRVGNRIAHARFELEGEQVELAKNHGKHHLHGGTKGYGKRLWSAEPSEGQEAPSVRLYLLDNDGEESYPGNVEVWVTFTLTNDSVLQIRYEASSDQPTPINLTNHAYWNLRDGGSSDILEHTLRLNASAYTEVDAELIPTGRILSVEGTPFDFRVPKPIGRDFELLDNQPRGYDHNFVLDGARGSLQLCAEVTDPHSGRKMETWTTEPGVQFYSGNFLDGSLIGKGGARYGQYHGFCLETQHFPDSIHHPNFPNTILRPGETYRQTTEYRFSVQD